MRLKRVNQSTIQHFVILRILYQDCRFCAIAPILLIARINIISIALDNAFKCVHGVATVQSY